MAEAIIEWRKYIAECTAACSPQFKLFMEEKGLQEVDSTDFLSRICLRYVNYSNLIHLKVKRYFESLWGLHGVANQFSIKDAKWLLPLIQKRVTDKKNKNLSQEDMKELLLWCAIRYNFWLAQQL